MNDRWRICVDVGTGRSWYIQEICDGDDIVVTPCRGLATVYESEEEYEDRLQYIRSWTTIHQSLVWLEKV